MAWKIRLASGSSVSPAVSLKKAIAFLSTSVYAVLILRHLGSLLDGERVLAGRSTEAEEALEGCDVVSGVRA